MLRSWKPARWRAKVLFDACLRKGVMSLARGGKVEQVAADARSQFLLIAADPGLDMIGDPYREAKNWCALLEVVLRWISLQTLPVLMDVPTVRVDGLAWKVIAWGDDAAGLHRWVTVDSWDTDALSRELHSWRTIGDIVMTKRPMTLHVIELGQHRAGKHIGAWSRTFYHPGLPNLKWRFNKPEDTSWKSVYFADQRVMCAEEWVTAAERDGALSKLSHELLVKVPNEAAVEDTIRQMKSEARAMQELLELRGTYRDEPMSRAACDLYVPCMYQPVCYSDGAVDMGRLNFVQAAEAKT